ncbi:hypothetical protein Tco_0491276 [Tanacetum coccineum]
MTCLTLHEETLPKKDANPALHAIRAGRVQKNQKNKPTKLLKGVMVAGLVKLSLEKLSINSDDVIVWRHTVRDNYVVVLFTEDKENYHLEHLIFDALCCTSGQQVPRSAEQSSRSMGSKEKERCCAHVVKHQGT